MRNETENDEIIVYNCVVLAFVWSWCAFFSRCIAASHHVSFSINIGV